MITVPIKTKGKPTKENSLGAPADVAVHIQRKANPKKINPNGIETKLGSMNAFLSGLPLQSTFSFAFSNLFNFDM